METGDVPLLEYYRLHDDVESPFFATKGSACFDLHAHLPEDSSVTVYRDRYYTGTNVVEAKIFSERELQIFPGEKALVPTGLIFNIPENWSVRLHPRSGMSLKKHLILGNCEGVIDCDYVDPVFVIIWNTGFHTQTIKHGERICQGEMVKFPAHGLKETEIRPERKTDRSGGFGSTGE